MTSLQAFDLTILNEVCPAGEAWMCEVQKGQCFRIIDLEGNQAVDTLFILRATLKSVTVQLIL